MRLQQFDSVVYKYMDFAIRITARNKGYILIVKGNEYIIAPIDVMFIMNILVDKCEVVDSTIKSNCIRSEVQLYKYANSFMSEVGYIVNKLAI